MSVCCSQGVQQQAGGVSAAEARTEQQG